MSALEPVLTFIITSPAMTSAAGDDAGRGRLLTKDRHVDQKGADCADAGPDRIGGAQGNRPHGQRQEADASNLIVMAVGQSRVKPSDCFIA
jgi:hypothetical protein